MRRFVIEIVCENEAFQDGNEPYEVAGILEGLIEKVQSGRHLIFLKDSNGNSCGVAQYTGE